MRVYLASTDPVTPSALEIMKNVKDRTIPNVQIELAPIGEHLPPKATVLALGKYERRGDERIVAAPSVGQIMTKADIVTRLGTAFRLLVDPPVLPPMEYTVIDDRGSAVDFIASLSDRDIVVDIETSGDVSVDQPDPSRIIAFGFTGGGHNYIIPEELCTDPFVVGAICHMMENNRITAVNGKFDLKYVDAETNFYFDVQLAHYALFPAAGEHGLKPSAKKYFGADDWDEPGKKYTKSATYKEAWRDEETGAWADARKYSAGSGFERIPRPMLYEYLAYDLYYTALWKKLMQEYLADDPDSQRVLDLLMQLSDMFMQVEKRGIHLDVDYLEQLSKELHVEKQQAELELNEIAGKEINPRSPKQVAEYFASIGTKLKSTNEATMQKLIEADSESLVAVFAEQLLVCRGLAKTLGTYVDGYRNQAIDGKVYPGYKLIASTTGRLGGAGASMLTIPRDKRLKRMVTASGPGRVVIGADLSQAELRVMAMESLDEWLISAFQPGAPDFFDNLLSQAYPKQDWVAMHNAVNEHTATEAEANLYNAKRARMKGVVYGVSFGRGTPAIAGALKISMYEAQTLVDAFVRPGSMFAMWREDITDRALKGEEIKTQFGRHFQSELVTQKNKQNVINSALSFMSQSTANDICLSATLEVNKQLAQYDAWLMGTIHDAIYVDGPEEHKEAIGELLAEELRKAGERVYGTLVPFDADWGYGPTLADV